MSVKANFPQKPLTRLIWNLALLCNLGVRCALSIFLTVWPKLAKLRAKIKIIYIYIENYIYFLPKNDFISSSLKNHMCYKPYFGLKSCVFIRSTLRRKNFKNLQSIMAANWPKMTNFGQKFEKKLDIFECFSRTVCVIELNLDLKVVH